MLSFRSLIIAALVLGFMSTTGLFAQDQGPVIGSEGTPPIADQQAADQPDDGVRRVLIVGDQLAGGLGAGLSRMTEEDDTVEVVNRFNETSGLTRPEIYDWAAAIPKMVEGKDFTTAMVLIGLNDRREMRDGNKILNFNSPEWVVLYKSRIDAVIDALQLAHLQVFWMSAPAMGDPGLDADMQVLSTYAKERVVAKGATFIDIRTPLLGPDGKFSDRGLDDTGTDRRLRESDGVTFLKSGNNRLGQIALAALNAAPQISEPAPIPDAAPPIASPDVDNNPVIGQEAVDDVASAGDLSGLRPSFAANGSITRPVIDSTIGIAAAKGSNAEALFTKGLAGPAPAGRFDNFSVAPAGN